MKIPIILSAFVFLISSIPSSLGDTKDARTLSLFNVVKFTNSECQAKSDATLKGTCFSESECSDKGGTKDGNCAQGFGSCCVFKNNVCGSTLSQNNSYIENPGYPNKFDGTSPCAFKVQRMQSNICQVRLDFTDMELAGPGTAQGNCATDNLVIAPGATNAVRQSMPPTLCGTNTGHHVYVDAGTADIATTLTFTISATSTANWRIKVSQIECDSEYKPPNGCLQYFTGIKNKVTSFNYDGTRACTPFCNLQNQDYNVCFKAEKGMCGMQYVENSKDSDSFLLNDNSATTAAFTFANCANGGLQIPVANDEFTTTQGIYCGATLGSVAAATTPNVIPGDSGSFMFRHYALNQATVAGFSVDATQVPC